MKATYPQVMNNQGSIPSTPRFALARVGVHTRTHEGASGRVRVCACPCTTQL